MYVSNVESGANLGRDIPWLQKIIHVLDKVGVFSRWTNIIGLAALFSMVVLTFIDVILRYIFNSPIKGVLEITEVMMICAIFLAVAFVQKDKGHIGIDIITSKLSHKAKLVMEFITTLFSIAIFSIAVWRTFKLTMLYITDHRIHSQNLAIPSGPFAAIISLGLLMMLVLLIRDLLKSINESFKLRLSISHWLVMISIPIIFGVLAYFWLQPDLWQLSLPLVGLIGVIFSLVLFMTGMPISFVLILTSFLFIGHIRGMNAGLDMIGIDFYRTSGSYTWSVLPFFVLMGFVCFHGKFGEDLYYAAYRWVGHFKGGLAVATIGACTGFAAIVGDPLAAIATMGTTALPQMRKYRYNDLLSAGSILGGSSLGPIIPPSTTFIIYGLLTGLSVGDLLISGLIPGLLLAFLFIVVIVVWCRINPNAGPAGEKFSWKQRFVSLKAGGPILILFILVIGGIYLGIFTPTEGGAIGAVCALIVGLVMRRFNFRIFGNTLAEAGKTVAMVFLILIGALMFSRFMAWCNISGTATDLIAGMGLSATTFVIFAILINFLLGFVIDIMPLLMIGIPILAPIAVSLGVDPIWFAVLMVITINLGGFTPPVGVSLFTLKALSKDLPMSSIFKGAFPFVMAVVVGLIILFIFPAIATWLPSLGK